MPLTKAEIVAKLGAAAARTVEVNKIAAAASVKALAEPADPTPLDLSTQATPFVADTQRQR